MYFVRNSSNINTVMYGVKCSEKLAVFVGESESRLRAKGLA